MNRPTALGRREDLKQRVLGYIQARPGCTFRDLRGAFPVHLQNLTSVIRVLIDEGAVIRAPDPADRRIRRYRPRLVAKTCARCGRPLPPRKHRFCSDPCRIRKQKAERVIENSDYAAGVVRQIRTMGARASSDLDALAWLATMASQARHALALAVDGCRARGYSDGEIGQALGTTRQAVGQRFGRKHDVHTGPAESGVAG